MERQLGDLLARSSLPPKQRVSTRVGDDGPKNHHRYNYGAFSDRAAKTCKQHCGEMSCLCAWPAIRSSCLRSRQPAPRRRSKALRKRSRRPRLRANHGAFECAAPVQTNPTPSSSTLQHPPPAACLKPCSPVVACPTNDASPMPASPIESPKTTIRPRASTGYRNTYRGKGSLCNSKCIRRARQTDDHSDRSHGSCQKTSRASRHCSETNASPLRISQLPSAQSEQNTRPVSARPVD